MTPVDCKSVAIGRGECVDRFGTNIQLWCEFCQKEAGAFFVMSHTKVIVIPNCRLLTNSLRIGSED